MIRMGRSSKSDDTNDSGELTRERPSTGVSYSQEYGSQNKALSESEAMAKDIKEGRLNGFVGHGTVLTGETYFNSMLRVDGHLTGKVVSEDGTLIVGSTGQVDANVAVSGAMINGTVNGDIIATDRLELGRTARVVGNIQAPRLIIEEGAVLEGHCSMVQATEEVEEPADEEQEEYSVSDRYEIRESSEASEDLTSYGSDSSDDDEEESDDESENSLNAAV